MQTPLEIPDKIIDCTGFCFCFEISERKAKEMQAKESFNVIVAGLDIYCFWLQSFAWKYNFLDEVYKDKQCKFKTKAN